MKNKILLFISGLLAGLVIGVLFSVAIKELLLQFKELHISLNKIDLKQSQLSQRLDSIQGKLIPDAKKAATTNTAVNAKVVASTSTTQPAQLQATANMALTSNINPVPNMTAKDDSDVVVMTNQLIVATSVSVENRDTIKGNKKTEKMDSTIAAMSDVTESKEPQEYRIEFWKSPLNYKGYKMSRNTIVVYGVQPAGGEIWISKNSGSYYLINGLTPYRLEYTDDYKPLEQVTDKATLKKLRL
jgi:hypothetical protein